MELHAMSDEEQHLLPLVPGQTAILARCSAAFCHAVNEKFNCTAILRNIEEADSLGSKTSGVFPTEKRYSTKLSSKVEISVWKDDLTRHPVVAVVNAANEKLNHAGGLAQALSEAGGPIIQKLSDDIIKKVKRVKTGEAVITRAGSLLCEHIIHAVGPCVPPNPSRKEVDNAAFLLQKAIFSVLHIVATENISSVAIPALSSGLFHFPRDRCAQIIVKAIKDFQDYTGFHNKNVEIRLVNHDEPSVQEMEKAARAMFGPSSNSVSYSGSGQGSPTSGNTMQFGKVTLHLKNGAIEDEKVDVIVNTISSDCNLRMGLISNAILNKAGRGIQEDINRLKYRNHSNVYETNGHELNSQKVYHTVCEHRSHPMATQILFQVISECLRKAASQYKSISFPAIGTGNRGFQKQEVARIMTGAVADFAKENKKKLDAYFVVFPKDTEMMEAFKKEMTIRQGQAGREGKSPDVHNDMTSERRFASSANQSTANETPTLEFQSVTTEALREAKEWTVDILQPSNCRTIKNNHVIYLGQKDHEYLLSLQIMLDVRIEEFFKSGNGGITITGSPLGVSCAAIEVESMLCKAQNEFVQAEESEILYSVVRWSCKNEPWIQTPEISAALEKAYLAGIEEIVFKNHKVNLKNKILLDNTGRTCNVNRTCLLTPLKPLNKSFYAKHPLRKEERKAFDDFGLYIIKVEKLENMALEQLFNRNRERLQGTPKRHYQRVSAQFCDLICRVGFQKEFAPPAEQMYGSGIYFTKTVKGALKLWNDVKQEQYIYIIQAKVLTGKDTIGGKDFILPPPLQGDPLERYDSLSDKGEMHVIFSGQQALPEYLIICVKQSKV